jgi:hypothetical protein
VSDACQLLWFHLRTTPLSNALGCYKASLEGLAAEKRWAFRRYKQTFGEGLAKGLWKYDPRFQVIYFPRYFKYNRPENPNVLISWLKCLDEIPDCQLKTEMIESLKAAAQNWGQPFERVTANLSGTLGQTFAKQEQEQEQEQDKEQEQDIEGRKKQRPAKATPVPDSFPLTDNLKEWASKETPGLNLEAETEKFLDHHRSKGNLFKDWPAAWRKWMRNAAEWGHARNNARGGAAEDEAKLERARAIHEKLQKSSKSGEPKNGSVSMAAKPG